MFGFIPASHHKERNTRPINGCLSASLQDGTSGQPVPAGNPWKSLYALANDNVIRDGMTQRSAHIPVGAVPV